MYYGLMESAVDIQVGREDSMPTVDLLIPFHRIDNYLKEAIASGIASKNVSLRAIVINDSNQEISKEELGLRQNDLLIKSRAKGYLGALSTGAELCSLEYVAFLDSDDLHDEERLAVQIAHLQKTSADMVSCNLKKFVGNKVDKHSRSLSGSLPIFKLNTLKLLFGSYGADSSLVIKRQVVEATWHLHKKYPYQLADYAWLISAINGGYKYIHTNEVSYQYRTHSNQISRSSGLRREWEEVHNLWQKLFISAVGTKFDISPNLSLLLAFPSSLTKISRLEMIQLREIQGNLLEFHLSKGFSQQIRLRILIGIREVIGRRGRTLKSLWIFPIICFEVTRNALLGTLFRVNNK